MNREKLFFLQVGIRQTYEVGFPRQSEDTFGLRDGCGLIVKYVTEDGATVGVQSTDPNDLVGSTEVLLTWDDFGHWTGLLARFDSEHGVAVTDKFFAR